jgi:isochorismate hydrolase
MAKTLREPTEKIDWKKELRASWVIKEIESYFDTYWDAEYVLFKIKKAIAKYQEKGIEEAMDKYRIE